MIFIFIHSNRLGLHKCRTMILIVNRSDVQLVCGNLRLTWEHLLYICQSNVTESNANELFQLNVII